jgi:rsbT co-antagonist protein RsbR
MIEPILFEQISLHEADILDQWLNLIVASGGAREDLIKSDDLRVQCRELLRFLAIGLEGASPDLAEPAWKEMREFLDGMSRSRAIQGFSPSQTANFILSLKEPLFLRARGANTGSPEALADLLWSTTTLVDNLALYTMESFQRTREEVIRRQQEEMLELSTPVVKLWDGILALPLIGTLDSARTQVVMETLLQRVLAEGTEVVILDITGVPTVDTLVAQHLLKTVTAARLMGTDCIISGIRPQIAQTIVHLGVDLTSVITKSSLADAFKIALARLELAVVKRKAATSVNHSA